MSQCHPHMCSRSESMKMNRECEAVLRYLSKEEAVTMEMELLRDYGFGWEQLAEMLGHACAVAITKVYPLSSLEKHQATVLVICGPGHNGCVGLVCARYLHLFDYIPTVFCPTPSRDALQQNLTVQCQKMDLPFLSYLPTEVQLVNDAYNLVVDAVLGSETEPDDVSETLASVLHALPAVTVPIVSLDIPSDWEREDSMDRINPSLLISLMTPKTCTRAFSGRHILAGRFLPYDIQKKYQLNLPKFPGTDCLVQL